MIDNITYDELNQIINLLEKSYSNINNIVESYKNTDVTTVKMERFCVDLNKYIVYLNNSLKINKDADTALGKIKEL